LVDDAVQEGTEVFTMDLSSPSANATIARSSATATIIDNDAPSGTPQVSISDLVVDEAAGTANFVITLDRPSTGVVSINYATQDGAPVTGADAAHAGSDYVAASGTLKFGAGETAKTVKVGLINDTLNEGAEAFSLALSGLVGATALNPVGTAVIGANDEPVVSKASISIDDVVVGEQDGFADFVIRLDAPTSAPVTVNYSTGNSTAFGTPFANPDYVSSSGALTFAAGETVKTVRVQLVDDAGRRCSPWTSPPQAPTPPSRAAPPPPRSSTMMRLRARRRSQSATSWSTRRRGRRISSSPSTARAPASYRSTTPLRTAPRSPVAFVVLFSAVVEVSRGRIAQAGSDPRLRCSRLHPARRSR
jgi:hypothetical protein